MSKSKRLWEDQVERIENEWLYGNPLVSDTQFNDELYAAQMKFLGFDEEEIAERLSAVKEDSGHDEEVCHKLAVVIGRFQPFHRGHLSIIFTAQAKAEKVLVLVGSTDSARTPKNPFTFEERKMMIENCLHPGDENVVTIQPIVDSPYSDSDWVDQIVKAAQAFEAPEDIVLVGHKSDISSYYLDLLPFDFVDCGELNDGMHATGIREMMFAGYGLKTSEKEFKAQSERFLKQVPEGSWLQIQRFMAGKLFKPMRDEYDFYEGHKKSWEKAPYPPTFQTVDALVRAGKNVLLVERANAPGKGLLALPGGYVDAHETLAKATIRELREETGIRLTDAELDNAQIKYKTRTFDYPGRSLRGRMYTQVSEFSLWDDKLPANRKLPYVKAADDASNCIWMHVDDMNPTEFFEDHYFIIQEMLK